MLRGESREGESDALESPDGGEDRSNDGAKRDSSGGARASLGCNGGHASTAEDTEGSRYKPSPGPLALECWRGGKSEFRGEFAWPTRSRENARSDELNSKRNKNNNG